MAETLLQQGQIDGLVSALNGKANWHIGQIVPSTLPITDAGLHLLDGALISGSGTYAAFVDYIGDLYDGGSYSGLFETEANWQAAVTAYGVCGKFVYDSVNNTVRLPLYNSKIYTGGGTAPIISTGIIKTHLQDVNGNTTYNDPVTSYLSQTSVYGISQSQVNAFTNNTATQEGYIGLGSTNGDVNTGLVAKLSEITTSLDGYYYIVIATTTKTDIQADIDQIASDLNLKAETDLSNLTSAGNIYGSKLYAPSNVSEAVTIGSSGANYTAPSNGWVHAQGQQTSSGGWIALVNATSGILSRAQTSYNNSIHNIYIPVQKGDTFQFHWTNVGSRVLTFIYAEGSKTEA